MWKKKNYLVLGYCNFVLFPDTADLSPSFYMLYFSLINRYFFL